MNRFFDLRFVIGLFFLIMGLMLLGHYFLGRPSDSAHHPMTNLYSAISFLVFAILMLLLSLRKVPGNDGHEETHS